MLLWFTTHEPVQSSELITVFWKTLENIIDVVIPRILFFIWIKGRNDRVIEIKK